MFRHRGFGSYFIFIVLLLGVVAVSAMLNNAGEDYTREQFVADMEAGKVKEVTVHPNSEVPTGYLLVDFDFGDDKKLYVSDVVEAEALVRAHGFRNEKI